MTATDMDDAHAKNLLKQLNTRVGVSDDQMYLLARYILNASANVPSNKLAGEKKEAVRNIEISCGRIFLQKRVRSTLSFEDEANMKRLLGEGAQQGVLAEAYKAAGLLSGNSESAKDVLIRQLSHAINNHRLVVETFGKSVFM